MKLETFFEKFDLFADAPDAVARMRELVLWFAFSGAFSAEERSQPMPKEWAKEGAPELPAIPASWKWQRGSDVFDVIRGVSYKKSDASDVPVEGSFPLLRANNIGNGINFDELVFVPRDNIRDEQFVQHGDILIAMSSGSKKLVGKAAPIVAEFNGAFGAFCGVIRNKSSIPDEVLARYFQTPQYTSWVIAAGRGIGINNLGKSDLDSLPIPTPPLAEQKRIVAKVDELMALCDRLEAQQQERETRHAALARASLARFAAAPTPANLNFIFHPSYHVSPADLRKAILTLAVQGKLVPQDPNDEPAEKLCAHDEDVAAASLFEVPDGWIWSRLARLAEINGGFAFKSTAYTEEGTRVVRISDFDEFGFKDHKVVRHPLSADLQKFTLEEHNILMAMTGGTVGKSYFVRSMPEPMIVNQRVATIKVSDSALPGYIDIVIRSEMTQEVIRKAKNSTNDNISMGDIKGFTVPLPPLAEQRRIVAKVEQLMALVDALEQQLAASRVTAEKLLTALVAELTAATTQPSRVLMAAEDPGHYDATVKVPSLSPGLAFARATLAAEIVHRMHGDRTFGQIKFQKALYLTEYIAQLDQIESHPRRFQNGPHDPELIAQVEAKMKECEWFEAIPRAGGHGHEYHALSKAGGHQAHFDTLWPKQAAVIRRLIDEMKTWKTERCERFATLYAAWNDLLIWKQPADDAAILDQVLKHWHSAKQQIPKSSWQDMLVWMKREGYVPTGWGRSTKAAPTAELFPV